MIALEPSIWVKPTGREEASNSIYLYKINEKFIKF